MNKKSKTIIWIVVAVVVIGLVGMIISNIINAANTVSFTELEAIIQTEDVQAVYVDGYVWQVVLKDGSKIEVKMQ